ncbi:hypothetical protein SAMN05421831_102182 [Allopseudospirillum japonicum]|uniref:Auto-transporter adhesin head GIN domain-containing protein n=1 Tax=Allopseudospirillum japonicum TaxID=64971 RepID=A0A1H6QTE2_9GAMM|nr:hypothetical protein [Allopseudospirillum japonicum]SEI46833.1 hypothetical protein SAMN05421831_102182 [Allopseudospirillum japonicum]
MRRKQILVALTLVLATSAQASLLDDLLGNNGTDEETNLPIDTGIYIEHTSQKSLYMGTADADYIYLDASHPTLASGGLANDRYKISAQQSADLVISDLLGQDNLVDLSLVQNSITEVSLNSGQVIINLSSGVKIQIDAAQTHCLQINLDGILSDYKITDENSLESFKQLLGI